LERISILGKQATIAVMTVFGFDVLVRYRS